MLSLRYFPHPVRFLSSASVPLPTTWLSVSSVPLDPRFCLTAASTLLRSTCASRFFLFRSTRFPVFPFRFSVLPSFAPTAVPLVLTFHFFQVSGLIFRFLSSVSVLGSDYSVSVSSFPLFFPLRLTVAFRCSGSLSVSCLSPSFASFPPRFPVPRYSAFCSFPFALPDFAPTAVPSVLTFRFRFRSFLLTSAFFRPLPF